jgi:hypothetical protein
MRTYFARLGDVAHMIVSQYQATMVMQLAPAGPRQFLNGFVFDSPGSGGVFGHAGIFNSANVMEFTNGLLFQPSGYVPIF